VDVGIVTGVQSISWQRLELRGAAAHAGTTPIEYRQDAGLAAATVIVEVRYRAALWFWPVEAGPHDLDPAQHAERAIERATGRDRVDMRSHQHARQRIVLARPATVDIADAVYPDNQPSVPHPGDDLTAGLRVLVGQGKPTYPGQAGSRVVVRPDARKSHQRAPQPISIDPD
jgi:hypothetical protein